jgi:glycosyltransferase involved in cell wall biosynthesis
MLHLFFPIGNGTGWATCGKHLALELCKRTEVGIVTTSKIIPDDIGDELEYFALSQIPVNSINEGRFDKENNRFKGVSVRMLNDFNLSLWLEDIKSEKTIGYTFYYGFPLSPEHRDSAKQLELVVAGSSFCEQQLNKAGIENTKTIIQGINPQIFNPTNSAKSLFKDRFVVFSGGKFEFRKGQDVVIRAFKIFSDKHPDALLINSWFNLWEFSLSTMAASTLIEFSFDFKDYMASMKNLYKMNGLDPDKVITLPIKPSFQLAHIYKNTDVGLFPNRCEGGTNLMLMEYMACGKPVIAAAETGHADVVKEDNAFPIKNCAPVKMKEGDFSEYQGWVEPDVDEILSHLEAAYDNQELCKQKGEAAGRFLSGLTWQKAATEFYEIAKGFM